MELVQTVQAKGQAPDKTAPISHASCKWEDECSVNGKMHSLTHHELLIHYYLPVH